MKAKFFYLKPAFVSAFKQVCGYAALFMIPALADNVTISYWEVFVLCWFVIWLFICAELWFNTDFYKA